MTLAVLDSTLLDNRWRHADLGDGVVATRNTEHQWSFLIPPDIKSAKSVICLDGTPTKEMWELVLDSEVERLSLIPDHWKEDYLKEVLGLNIIQTTKNWNAYQGGAGVSPTVDIPLIEEIGRRYAEDPGVITTKKAIRQYGANRLSSLSSLVANYGALKGVNKFSTSRVGVVLGNPHPGDEVIQRWSAFAGKSAQRVEGSQGEETDYGYFGNRIFQDLVHKEVLQAVMRFGREEINGERGATVFVHTSALPDWVNPEEKIANVNSWITEKEGMRKVIEAIKSLDNWKSKEWGTGEIAEQIDNLHRETIRNRLNDLVKHGYLDSYQGGRGNKYHFSNARLEQAGKYGHVEL